MKITRITVSVIVALNIASAARAQETLKGEVVAIDRASKKISIKLGGTVAPSDTTAPTPFKIQDALMFDAVKLGDKFSFQHANPAPDGIFGKDTGEANTSRRSCLITSPATSGPCECRT
ncbi:MAG: hypothetical protein WBY84_09350 [Pseudolabrys sp.]|jgi:Cu/Ag efflux protein CusF